MDIVQTWWPQWLTSRGMKLPAFNLDQERKGQLIMGLVPHLQSSTISVPVLKNHFPDHYIDHMVRVRTGRPNEPRVWVTAYLEGYEIAFPVEIKPSGMESPVHINVGMNFLQDHLEKVSIERPEVWVKGHQTPVKLFDARRK